MRLTPVEKTFIKAFLILVLWQVLELIFYGEVQPRKVDSIINIFLIYYIYKSEVYKDERT